MASAQEQPEQPELGVVTQVDTGLRRSVQDRGPMGRPHRQDKRRPNLAEESVLTWYRSGTKAVSKW